MLKAIKNWYNKQQAISNEYRKEAVKNFAEAGITIKNIKKIFSKLIPLIIFLAIGFIMYNYVAPFFLIVFVLFVIAILSILKLIF
jgi:hypothetical protein